MTRRDRWERLGWALPWLLFLAFPIADAFTAPRPVLLRAVAIAGLATFTISYVTVFGRFFARDCPPVRVHLAIVGVLGVALPVSFGPSWAGLLIYVCAAAATGLPDRWVWPTVVAATAVCSGILLADGLFDALFVLPLICLLTAFGVRGIRYLISVNAELREAREELARNAVAEERLRFARDLHDLLGHSLSMIALKSELAGRLAERDPVRARQEMADVEAAARRALAEVREAVGGYRQVALRQSIAEARGALSAAGITVETPTAALETAAEIPGEADAVLGWVVREATTNVLRHSGAERVTVALQWSADVVTLVIADDGRGVAGPRGTGLTGLAERLEAIGGRLDTHAKPGAGYRLTAVVPVTVTAPHPVTAR
jgi:two-component system sensor histidine kinase DesK